MAVFRWGLVGAGVAGLAAMSDCMDPTEVVIDIATNVACSVVSLNGVAIAVGAPGQDDAGVNTVTMLCGSDGGVGSMVITPSGSPDESVGIRVVLGIDASAETCASGGVGACIVARRALHFTPHTPLTLPIDLDQACIGVPCGPYTTCVSGSCVDASVPDCPNGVCTLPDASPPPPCTNVTTLVDGSGTTPHIARTSQGYVVTWLTATYAVGVTELDGQGNVLHGPFAMVSSRADAGQLAGHLDAVGAQGTSYLVAYDQTYPANPTFYPMLMQDDGGVSIAPTTTAQPAAGPVEGVLWDAMDSTFIGLLAAQGTAQLWAVLPTQQELIGFPGGGIISGTSLAYWNGVYYASFTEDTACYVYNCTRGGPLAFISGSNTRYAGCAAVRTAASDTDLLVATADPTGNLTWSSNSSGSGTGGPAAPSAFVAVGTAPHFHVLWGTPTELIAQSTDGTPSSVLADITSGIGGAGGFDAVADDGSHEGYAVAYWGHGAFGPGVYFLHLCQ